MKTGKRNRFLEFLRYDLWIIILDIIGVNLAYYLAILMRFNVNNKFSPTGIFYLIVFLKCAPYYTALAILIFLIFRLYGGMWRYAGLNDMNRIILANIATTAANVVLTIVMLHLMPQEAQYRLRMPITYYVIGGCLQFVFVCIPRFGYRFLRAEHKKIAQNKLDTIPSLVVGMDDLGQKVVRHLEENTPYRVQVIVSRQGGRPQNGIQVVPMKNLEKEIKNRKIKAVFVADKELTKEERESIRAAAKDLELEDYTGYMSNLSGFLPLTSVLEVMEAPFTVRIQDESAAQVAGGASDPKSRTFSSAEECLATLPGEYEVVKIQGSSILLKEKKQDTSWMKAYKEQTGEDVSYF